MITKKEYDFLSKILDEIIDECDRNAECNCKTPSDHDFAPIIDAIGDIMDKRDGSDLPLWK